MPEQHRSLIHLLSACRTTSLGSHFEKCDHCSYVGKAYNSCRNRHCPACQQKDKLEWLPKGFFKVRYYGIFSSRYRKQNIETAKQLLAEEAETKKEEALEDGARVWEKQDTVWGEIKELIKNVRQPNCPACKKGRLRFAGIVRDVQWEPG